MAKRAFQVPVTFGAPKRRADDSVKLEFVSTQELSNEDFAELDAARKQVGYVLFAANQFSDGDIPLDDAPSDHKKPSQVTRGLLWHIWNKKTDRTMDSETYYKRRMAGINDKLRDELDDDGF